MDAKEFNTFIEKMGISWYLLQGVKTSGSETNSLVVKKYGTRTTEQACGQELIEYGGKWIIGRKFGSFVIISFLHS